MAYFESGIVFATHDGVVLRGDLHAPDEGRAHPVVVAVPGGAWLRGDRTDLAHWGKRLADAGIATFSIDYRRSTAGKIFPQNVQDVLAAIKFVGANAKVLGVDAARLGVMGASAGAHLAALAVLAGATPLFARAVPGDPPTVRTFAGIYGVYDLERHWRACQTATASPRDDMADRMMGGPLTGHERAYNEASPTTYMSAVDQRMKVLLAWGDADAVVLPAQSEGFASALRKAGVAVETHAVQGAGHFWFSKDKDTHAGTNGEIAPKLIRFLQQGLAAN